MKKTLLLLFAIFAIALVGCSDDKDNEYKESIIGTWELTEMNINGKWIPMIKPTYATFNNDGTYSGRGYFGNGKGTYDISGKTVICYIGGNEYVRYEIIDLSSTTCTLKMIMDGSNINIKCEKR